LLPEDVESTLGLLLQAILHELYEDQWVWPSFDPVRKVVPVWVMGRINQDKAELLLQEIKAVDKVLCVSSSVISAPTARR
jgi:IS1 family transposase